jgi:transglutaminase-like putative cysteine protease
MKIALAGMEIPLPSDDAQRCVLERAETVCQIRRPAAEGGASPDLSPAAPKYLGSSVTVQTLDPAIRKTAEEIVAGAGSTPERITRIVQWMNLNVEKAPLDVFSALDVLEKRKAECQGHAYLYTALARATGIPTRIVNGLAYSEQFNGFLYHSWAESLVDGRWVAVDPTFGQTAADATHIKVVEGETLAQLLPLMDVVGKLKIRVLSVEHQAP